MGVKSKKLKDIKIIYLNRNIGADKRYDWEGLTNSIKSEGFLPEKYGYIIVSKDGYILNGHHRYITLSKLYDEEYEVKVDVAKLNYNLLLTILFTLAIISYVIKKLHISDKAINFTVKKLF